MQASTYDERGKEFALGAILKHVVRCALSITNSMVCCFVIFLVQPDLVEIGEGSVIDDAAIVCHLNTKGNFSLVPIQIGAHVTMRKQARIQQGGVIKSGSMVLERSLVMTGDVIEQDDVWLGSPAQSISMSKGTEVTDKLC